MIKNKKRLALIVAAVFCFAMLFSALFIIAESNHDCTGENCKICYQINVCEQTLKNLVSVVLAIIISCLIKFLYAKLNGFILLRTYSHSLVTLKVKLSN